MIIAVPVNENHDDTNVCMSFGRAPYFLLYNVEKKQSQYLVNTAVNQQGGAGIKAAQLLVDNQATVLLSKRCGENAANVLEAAQIPIYKVETIPVIKAIGQYMAGELQALSEIHAGFHGKQG